MQRGHQALSQEQRAAREARRHEAEDALDLDGRLELEADLEGGLAVLQPHELQPEPGKTKKREPGENAFQLFYD